MVSLLLPNRCLNFSQNSTDVNPVMNRFDLWKVTSAWWFHVLILGKKPSGSSVTHTGLGYPGKFLFLISAKNKQMRAQGAWASSEERTTSLG